MCDFNKISTPVHLLMLLSKRRRLLKISIKSFKKKYIFCIFEPEAIELKFEFALAIHILVLEQTFYNFLCLRYREYRNPQIHR